MRMVGLGGLELGAKHAVLSNRHGRCCAHVTGHRQDRNRGVGQER
jgi:hypothetical protein